MKAVILAAGPNHDYPPFNFPSDSKPKCLFHIKGITLLDRMISMLNDAGINDIRVVVGYKKELIEEYVSENNLGIETVFDPKWGDSPNSLVVGVQDVDDDVLIIAGDIYPRYQDGVAIFKKFLTCDESLTWIRVKRPNRRWRHLRKHSPEMYEVVVDKEIFIVRAGREKLNIFEDADRYADEFIEIANFPESPRTPTNRLWAALYGIFVSNRPVGEVTLLTSLKDVDRYGQTDEWKKGMHK